MNARRRRLLEASSAGIVARDHRFELVTLRAHVRMIENTLDALELTRARRAAEHERVLARRQKIARRQKVAA